MDSRDPGKDRKGPGDSGGRAGDGGPPGGGESPHVYEFDDFRLDTKSTFRLDTKSTNKKSRLYRNGLSLVIPDTPFRLLCVLVENREREIGSEELVNLVWPNRAADSSFESYADNLHHQIKFLREKVGKDNIPHRRNAGYCFKPEVRVIPTPQPGPHVYDDFEFSQWVFSRECVGVKVFLVSGIVFSLVCAAEYLRRSPMDLLPDPAMVFSLIQFIVVVGALAASPSVFDRGLKEFPSSAVANDALMASCDYTDPVKWAEAKAGAESSRARYSRYWKFLLIAWTGLYLLLILTLYSKGRFDPNTLMFGTNPYHPYWALSIASTIFNNFNSLAIALCFVVLNHPTVFSAEEQDTSLDRTAGRMILWGGLAIAAATLVESVLVYYPRTEYDWVWFDWMTRANVVWAANLLSGVVGSITLALYVGRIQSKFLGPSTWLPLAFYLYVAIQSLYVSLIEGGEWGALIIEAALILKCLLYLYVVWLFKSGRLLFYLVRVKTVYTRVNIEWQDFILNLNRQE